MLSRSLGRYVFAPQDAAFQIDQIPNPSSGEVSGTIFFI